ncbi:MAG: hypothetical protein WDO74_06450 [Pseudomonadota bacterium]
MSIQRPVTGTTNCPVTGKTYVVGHPDAPTPPMDAGDRFVDGEGATIKCSVKASSSGFAFSGTITAPSSEKDPVTVSFTNGAISADKVNGTATVYVYTKEVQGFTSTAPCTVTVVSTNVKPGSLWATFSCPSIKDPTMPQECSIGPVGQTISNFVFENCDGS